MPRPLFVFRWPDRTALGGEQGKGEIVTRCRCAGAAGGCDGGEWAGEGAVWRGRRGKVLGLMSFLLLRPVGASGGGDPFCRCAGRREGAAAGRSLCRRCSGGAVSARAGGGCLACARPSFGRSFAAARRWGGGERLILAAGFSAGFPGDFCAPFEGAFRSAGGEGCGRPFGRRYDGGAWPSLWRDALPFCPAGERLGGGEGVPDGLLAGCARGARRCADRGKRACRGWRGRAPLRHGRGGELGGGGGEGALSQLPAGGAGGGLPMEKGAAVCYND